MTKIPRHLLPQIPSNKIDEFIAYLHENGILSGEVDLPTKQLKPIQAHINRGKVESIKNDPSTLKKRILVTKEGYIFDGHHRWVAAGELDHNTMPSIVCFGSLKKLLKLAHAFDHSYVKSVYEVTTYGRLALLPISKNRLLKIISDEISTVLSTKY